MIPFWTRQLQTEQGLDSIFTDCWDTLTGCIIWGAWWCYFITLIRVHLLSTILILLTCHLALASNLIWYQIRALLLPAPLIYFQSSSGIWLLVLLLDNILPISVSDFQLALVQLLMLLFMEQLIFYTRKAPVYTFALQDSDDNHDILENAVSMQVGNRAHILEAL